MWLVVSHPTDRLSSSTLTRPLGSTTLSNMLASSFRSVSRVLGSAAPKRASKSTSHSLKHSQASNQGPSPVSTRVRFYAGHHHHEEAPKPYKRTTLSPVLRDAEKTTAEQEREVKGIQGWIFGRPVTYIDPLKPLADTHEQKSANGWMFNRKVCFRLVLRSSCILPLIFHF